MNLSRNWLNEFVDLHDITDKQFNDEMTLSGSKVETIERLDESLKNVVAGKILSMEKHPDSDHMWVCQLDVGREEPVQIVTGAWNVHIDDLVPVAIGEREDIRKKPAPDTVIEALRELGVDKEGAVYIGDSDVDIMTAKNSGMPCVSVLWGFRDKEFLLEHGATTLISQPEDMP